MANSTSIPERVLIKVAKAVIAWRFCVVNVIGRRNRKRLRRSKENWPFLSSLKFMDGEIEGAWCDFQRGKCLGGRRRRA
jgi:hypothetical protein